MHGLDNAGALSRVRRKIPSNLLSGKESAKEEVAEEEFAPRHADYDSTGRIKNPQE